jgi:diacylglycerol kinase family enzyme
MSQANQVAVLLNRNAKRVNDRVVRNVHQWVPSHQVYATGSEEEAVAAVRDILDRGYTSVFAGGGDGTVMSLVNTLNKEAGQRPWPRIGVLRLGTGNALAHMVSTGAPEDDLRAFLTQQQSDDLPISMMEDDEGTLFPFAGVGLDAQILNDYNSFKNSVGKTFAAPVVNTVAGYFAAAFTKTIPRRIGRFVQRKDMNVRVRSTGDQAFKIGENGVVQDFYEEGALLYEGPFSMLVSGTTPYYGYGMKMLPFARRYPSMFQLRVTNANVAKTLAILPRIWDGTYQGKAVTDFAAEAVEIEFNEPLPYQVGGDASGIRQKLCFRVSPQPMNLIRLI